MKVYGELEFADLHNRTSDPSAGKIGRIYWQTTTGKVMLDDGTNIYAMLRNDGKLLIGNNGTAASNVRLHRGAAAVLQAVVGSDTTAEGTLSTALAQISAKFENYTEAGKPAAGNPGRVAWISDILQLKVDNGTNWTPLGGAGAGGINYIQQNNGNPDAELDLSGWISYKDTPGVAPIDGVGGVSDLVLTRSTVNPLRGNASFLSTQPNSTNCQGSGHSYDFEIDAADLASVVAVSVDFNASDDFVASSGQVGSHSSIEWFIYDKTNSLLIPCTPNVITAKGANNFKFLGEFQSSYNSTSYRLIAHCATTDAPATGFKFKFDNVVVGPREISYGAIITDWVPYTPTLSQFGTATDVNFTYKRVGDTLHIKGSFTAGITGGSIASFTIPDGLTVDTTKLTNSAARTVIGNWYVTQSGGAVGEFANSLAGPSIFTTDQGASNLIYFCQTVAANFYNLDGANTFAGNSQTVDVIVSIPILGWGSNVQLSQGADSRVIACRATLSTLQGITAANTQVLLDGTSFDTTGSFSVSANSYKVPVSDYYRIKCNISVFYNSAGLDVFIYQNGSSIAVGHGKGDNPYSSTIAFETVTPCIAGDVLEIYATPVGAGGAINGGAAETYVIFERVSGPSTIAASEKVSARYTSSAGQSINNSAADIIDFGTKDWDTNGAVTTGGSWKFIAPRSCKYEVSAAVLTDGATISGPVELLLFKNGVQYAAIGYNEIAAASRKAPSGTTTVYLLAGEYFDVRFSNSSGATRTLYASDVYNWITISSE